VPPLSCFIFFCDFDMYCSWPVDLPDSSGTVTGVLILKCCSLKLSWFIRTFLGLCFLLTWNSRTGILFFWSTSDTVFESTLLTSYSSFVLWLFEISGTYVPSWFPSEVLLTNLSFNLLRSLAENCLNFLLVCLSLSLHSNNTELCSQLYIASLS